MDTKEYSQEVNSGNDKKEQDNSLPKGVTKKPRNDEEMDLGTIKNNPAQIKAYLPVSDDAGEMLGDTILEKEVVDFCRLLKSLKPEELKSMDDPEVFLQQLKDLSVRYVKRINTAENISIGTATKYRIREGILFNLQKQIVKKVLGKNWTGWFRDNYDRSLFRSVQDYMRLARVPKVISYAWLGKEQLLQILRRIGKFEGDDPIGEFLADNGVDFNPEAEFDIGELKIKTDIAINKQKLVEEGLDAIPVEKVEAFVQNGNEILSKHIRELKLVRDTNGDLGGYMDRIIATDGKIEPVMTPDRKAESYKKVIDRFLKATDTAFVDGEYLGQIDADIFATLKQKVLELEQKISNNN